MFFLFCRWSWIRLQEKSSSIPFDDVSWLSGQKEQLCWWKGDGLLIQSAQGLLVRLFMSFIYSVGDYIAKIIVDSLYNLSCFCLKEIVLNSKNMLFYMCCQVHYLRFQGQLFKYCCHRSGQFVNVSFVMCLYWSWILIMCGWMKIKMRQNWSYTLFNK